MVLNEEYIDSHFFTVLFQNKSILGKANFVTEIKKDVQWSEGATTYRYLMTYYNNQTEIPRTVYVKFEKARASEHYKRLVRNETNFYRYIAERAGILFW